MPKPATHVAKRPDARGRIAYTPDEHALWRDLYARQLPSVRARMASAWLDGFARLGLPADRVPCCRDVSERLGSLSGWRVEPVPALIGFERFFGMLAARTFPAASFIRRRDEFDYVEEPDIFHELFGHGPLLADPRLAAFSEAIGRAGRDAGRAEHVWLIRLYWFTIEFGLVVESGRLRALGSGLASSPTELPWSVGGSGRDASGPLGSASAGPERRAFDVVDILRTPYRIDIHQPVYFVLEDIDALSAAAERDLLADVRRARHLGLFAPRYAPRAEAS